MKAAVVICPGRATYNAAELGWLSRHFPDPALPEVFDAQRRAPVQETLSALDGATRFSLVTGSGDATAPTASMCQGGFAKIHRGER